MEAKLSYLAAVQIRKKLAYQLLHPNEFKEMKITHKGRSPSPDQESQFPTVGDLIALREYLRERGYPTAYDLDLPTLAAINIPEPKEPRKKADANSQTNDNHPD
jgi:hypothetical protein